MIVPMLALTLFCREKDKARALDALSGFGAMHVDLEVTDSPAINAQQGSIDQLDLAMRLIDNAAAGLSIAVKCASDSPIAQLAPDALISGSAPVAPQDAQAVCQLGEMAGAIESYSQQLKQSLTTYAPFGNVSPDSLQALATSDLQVRLIKMPTALAKALPAQVYQLSQSSGASYFAWLAPGELPTGAELIPWPTHSTAQMQESLQAAQMRLAAITATLAAATALKPTFDTARTQALDQLRYVATAENMIATESIVYLRGYIPARTSEALQQLAHDCGWGFATRKPAPEESAPVLLEPPKCFRAITSLFAGLGILPAYNETDISVAFYAFFSLFFAMLVGDAGYGAIIFAGVLFGWTRVKRSPQLKPVLTIFTVFSVCTIIWGILSGTYFGIAQAALPDLLRNIPTVAWLGNQNNIMWLCFLLGAIHLSVARLWNAIQMLPDSRALGQLGWVGVIVCMYNVVCGIVVAGFAQPSWLIPAFIASIAVIAVFTYKPAELKAHAIDLAMLPLNIISSMGDIISYVRLFAVGMAAVKLAENFNTMATDLDLALWIKIPAMLLILLLGHGLNLVMGALSILVHAVRLNTLEFSGAKGISWSGVAYQPFTVSQPLNQPHSARQQAE